MRNLTLAIAAVLACTALPARAQDGRGAPAIKPAHDAQVALGTKDVPPALPGRFVFNRVDGGFLRLDNQNGHVDFCNPQPVGWACQAVPADRAVLDNEIARLKDEVGGLRAQVAALRAQPSAALPAATEKSEDTAKPRGELARARSAIENAWRRLVEIIVNLQKDMMHKS